MHADLDSAVAAVAAVVGGPVEGAICPHPGGPPMCWCRPPLPGLVLAFARRHAVDPARSLVAGTSPSHRTLAGVTRRPLPLGVTRTDADARTRASCAERSWTCGNAATRYAQAPISRIEDEATVSTDHAH